MDRIGFMSMLCLAALFVLAACERPDESAWVPAAGEEARDPRHLGYDPDTLSWFIEGRPVQFDGRAWRPVGRPVFERRDALRQVGEFEGMALYAATDASPPYEILFFPYSPETWQPLEPIDEAPAPSDAARSPYPKTCCHPRESGDPFRASALRLVMDSGFRGNDGAGQEPPQVRLIGTGFSPE